MTEPQAPCHPRGARIRKGQEQAAVGSRSFKAHKLFVGATHSLFGAWWNVVIASAGEPSVHGGPLALVADLAVEVRT